MDKLRIGLRAGLVLSLVALAGCGAFRRDDAQPVQTRPASEIAAELVRIFPDMDEADLTRCIIEDVRSIDGIVDTRTLIGAEI